MTKEEFDKLPDDEKRRLGVAVAILETIREITITSPLRGVPNGHLWCAMQATIDFGTYTTIIGGLKRSGLISERGHVLSYTGPEGSR